MENNIFIDILKKARKERNAVGAVNIFNYLTADAAISAANDIGTDIIIQTSTGTVKYYGEKRLYSMIDSIRRYANIQVALHLDHCRDIELGKRCVEAGWDSIMMDFSHLSLEENIANTYNMAKYAHARNVAIEGEVGVISGVEEEIVNDKAVGAGYEETVKFINHSNVDAIAPAIGTAHGVYIGTPKVDFELVEKLGKLETPIVIHGGSGLSVETFIKLIKLGGKKVNISTIVKNAYLGKIKEMALEKMAPLDFDDAVKQTVSSEIKEHLLIFNK